MDVPQEHGRFPYLPINARPIVRWPNNARVALWVIPNIEHFHYNAQYPGKADPGAIPDIHSYSQRDYGNRIGVWRLMEALDRHGIRATVALNSEVTRYEPEIVEAGVQRQWEWMGHGTSNSRRLPGMSEEEERDLIAQVAEEIRAATGIAPQGWLSPGLAETIRTLDLLKEAGFSYVSNWVNDDQPYPMQTRAGLLYAMPYSSDVNDKRIIEGTGSPAEQLERVICDAFDTLYEEGEHNGRVMAIALHPYLTGASHRIKYLNRALDYIAQHRDVWYATGSEIVEAYLKSIDQPD